MLHTAYIINNPLKPRDKFTFRKVQHTTLQVLDTAHLRDLYGSLNKQ